MSKKVNHIEDEWDNWYPDFPFTQIKIKPSEKDESNKDRKINDKYGKVDESS